MIACSLLCKLQWNWRSLSGFSAKIQCCKALLIVRRTLLNVGQKENGFRRNLQKLAQLMVFHINQPGYWHQFSTSNNSTSLFDHWLLYRHCAKLKQNVSANYDKVRCRLIAFEQSHQKSNCKESTKSNFLLLSILKHVILYLTSQYMMLLRLHLAKQSTG